MADWGYALGQGIGAGAQAASGLIDAGLKEDADIRAADRQLDLQTRLMAAQEAMQKRVQENAYQIQQRPNQEAGELLRSAAGDMPIPVSEVAELSGADPASAYSTGDGSPVEGMRGNYEELRKRGELIQDPQERADYLAQLDRQRAADAAGKTRPRTRDEMISAAMDSAAAKGNPRALALLKELAGEKFIKVGDTLVDQQGKPVYTDRTRYDEAEKADERQFRQQKELQRERLDAASSLADKKAAAVAELRNNPDGILSPDTVRFMAEQAMAGDTSVFTNLGRGAQGAENVIAVRSEIARLTREAGGTGADRAAGNAEYMGTKAGQRATGTRIANVEMAVNEAQNLIPLALEASQDVARSGLLPFGKAQIMFNNQTNDPALRKFAAANNALVNVYSRAISPTGQPTIADKEHARELLSTAYDQPSYEAVVKQMQMEMTAAQRAPQQVREEFNRVVTGRGGHGGGTVPNPVSNANPAIDALVNKYRSK